MIRTKIIFFTVGILFVLSILIFRPVPQATEGNLISAQGVLVGVTGNQQNKDIFFKIKDDQTVYYVNRGLESGLIVSDLSAKLLNKTIIIRYPKYWTPLDPKNNSRHVSELRIGAEVIYTEL